MADIPYTVKQKSSLIFFIITEFQEITTLPIYICPVSQLTLQYCE